MAIVLKKNEKVIFIESPQVEVTIQALHNAISIRMDDPGFMDTPPPETGFKTIHETTGKQDLFGGVAVGLTLALFDDWRIEFEGRAGPAYIAVRVSGGNITTSNSFGDNPIKPSAFTQVQTAQSSSATLQGTALLENIKFLIESQDHITHSGFGSTFYVNPRTGDDGLDGLSAASPLKTVTYAHDSLVVAGRGDVIIVVGDSPTGTTTLDERLTITKSGTIIRGPGVGLLWKPSTGTASTVVINAPNVEIANLEIQGSPGNVAAHGVEVQANGVAFVLKGLNIRNCAYHGVDIQTTGFGWHIVDCRFAFNGHAVHAMSQAAGRIINTRLAANQIGIHFAGTASPSVVYVEDCFFEKNTVYGIHVEAGVAGVTIRGNCAFVGNAQALRDDNGTTFVGSWDALTVEPDTQREFIAAVVDTAVGTRNVGAGKLDRIVFTTRGHGDSDFDNPILAKTLYAWYTNLGDDNPIKIGNP